MAPYSSYRNDGPTSRTMSNIDEQNEVMRLDAITTV